MYLGKKLIEIRKGEFHNRGAQLMLLSARDYLESRGDYLFATTVSDQSGNMPYDKRVKMGFFQKPFLWKKVVNFGWLLMLTPRKFRESFGIVTDRDIDVVLDISGFSYSDQWGRLSCFELFVQTKVWSALNVKVILMPQAFGPFTSFISRYLMKKIIGRVEILFVRDPVSHAYLQELAPESSNIVPAPDFTNLCPSVNVDREIPGNLCIVPNHRMLDKTSSEVREKYVDFLAQFIRISMEDGFIPFFLIHEGSRDMDIANTVSRALGVDIDVIDEEDPQRIKALLSKCDLVYGDRYHSLISAMSQGIPCLASGWSHKYETLFRDYNVSDMLVDISESSLQLETFIKARVASDQLKKCKDVLLDASSAQKQATRDMWSKVERFL
jgi:polysaccharide pyruvyl transferase WcaK-like protein